MTRTWQMETRVTPSVRLVVNRITLMVLHPAGAWTQKQDQFISLGCFWTLFFGSWPSGKFPKLFLQEVRADTETQEARLDPSEVEGCTETWHQDWEEQEKLARSSCPPTPRVLDSPDHMTHARIHLKGPFRELNLKGPIRTSSFGAALLLLPQAPTLVLRPRGRRFWNEFEQQQSPEPSLVCSLWPQTSPPVEHSSRSTHDAAGPPGPNKHLRD